MKKFKTKLATAVLATSVLLSTFSFAGTADAARPGFDKNKVGGTLVLSSFADAVRLVPYTTSDSASSDIQAMIYEGLIKTDDKGKKVPSLATSWKYDKGSMTYTVNLRKGVKWHDGKPFTADDVVFSINTYRDEKSMNTYKADFAAVGSVTKVNSHQVKFKLKEKDVFFESNVLAAPIIAKHKFPRGVADFNTNTTLHRNPVGTGAFKFSSWKTAERIVVKANTSHWDGRPYLDEVVTKIVPDANSSGLNLIRGSVDFLDIVTPSQLPQIVKTKSLKTKVWDEGRFDYIGLNVSKAPFDDQKVRQALTYGLDRRSVVTTVMLGKAFQASGPMHPLLPQNNSSVKPYDFDLKKAGKLLDEAGWKLVNGVRTKNGKKLEVEVAYNNGNKIREKVSLLAQQNWAKLGIKVVSRAYEWSIYLDKSKKGELDAFVLGWGGYTANTLEHYGLLHSSQWSTKGGNNRFFIDDKKIDKILEDYKQEESSAKRNKMYQDLHKYMAEKAYVIYTHHPRQTAAMNKDLGGVKLTLSNAFYNLEDWYWTKASKRK